MRSAWAKCLTAVLLANLAIICAVAPHNDANLISEGGTELKQDKHEKKEEIYRLPTSVYPTDYYIGLMPNFDDFSYTGSAMINITVRTATDQIVFHHRQLIIIVDTVIDGDESIVPKTPTYNETTEQYTVTLPRKLLADRNVSINLRFRGRLSDNMIGFYKSSYIDNEGKER